MIGLAAVVAIVAGLGVAVRLFLAGQRSDDRRDLAAELAAEREAAELADDREAA
jgi:hypothetical protein